MDYDMPGIGGMTGREIVDQIHKLNTPEARRKARSCNVLNVRLEELHNALARRVRNAYRQGLLGGLDDPLSGNRTQGTKGEGGGRCMPPPEENSSSGSGTPHGRAAGMTY